jgi:hypothetical protein
MTLPNESMVTDPTPAIAPMEPLSAETANTVRRLLHNVVAQACTGPNPHCEGTWTLLLHAHRAATTPRPPGVLRKSPPARPYSRGAHDHAHHPPARQRKRS